MRHRLLVATALIGGLACAPGCSKASRSHPGEAPRASASSGCPTPGKNLLFVGPDGSAPTLTWDDLAAIQAEVPGVCAAPALRSTSQLLTEDANWQTVLTGTTADYLTLRGWTLTRGAALDPDARQVILGQTVASSLFGAADPIGRTVRIKNRSFEVVGLLSKLGQTAYGQDQDDIAIVPVRAFPAPSVMPRFIAGSILVGAASRTDLDRAERQIDALLRDRHQLGPGQADYRIRNLAALQAALPSGL